MIWFMCLFLLSTTQLGSTYYHELSKKIFTVQQGHNAYFGYSIAYEPTKKLLVTSAPLSNIVGNIYICNIDATLCTAITTNITSQYNVVFEQNMWLGAVIKAAPSYFVTCAPLSINVTQSTKSMIKSKLGTFGQCYYVNVNDSPKLIQMQKISESVREAGTDLLEKTMDSFGWSIDIIDKSESILVGSPAMVSGRIQKYDDLKTIPTHINGDSCDVQFNFGYSVASGRFGITTDIIYAVGSTYGYGKVVFVNKHLEKPLELPKGTDQEMTGSMYGAVLCTVSLTGDKRDILVGAPTYASTHTQNRGAVYVYVRTYDYKHVPELKRKIVGETDNSYFGSAIVSVGDMNKDKKDEIAIGSPYENEGRGAVYLYSGADILKGGDTLVPLQKIKPEDKTWMTFGLSLSALEDYDDNGCNELAIGAPESDRIMLLRCMSSVLVMVRPRIPNLQSWRMVKNNRIVNATHFVFHSCLNVTYPDKPKSVIATIRMKVEVIHQYARLANPAEGEYIVSLNTMKKEYCKSITIYMQENVNYENPIEIIINATHVDDPINDKDFQSSRVRLSDRSVLHHRSTVWAAECSGKNHKCLPKLEHVDIKLSVTTKKYVIGSTDSITAAIFIRNTGEVAYDACLRVRVDGARFLQATELCSLVNNGRELLCSPKQILRNGDPWNTKNITIETKHLTSRDQRIVIESKLYNNCNDKNDSTTFGKIIDLMRDYDGVSIKGMTNTGIDNYVNITSYFIGVGKMFEHVYKITNHGTTTWVGLKFKLTVQKLKYIEIKSVWYQTNGAECTEVLDKENEREYTCDIEELTKTGVTVSVSMHVLPNTVGDIIEKQNLTVYSKMTLDLLIEDRYAEVISILKLQEAIVPLWLYISTGIAGLLILILIFFILRELGCLTRKNKVRLDRVRQSVRRQTVIKNRSREFNCVRRERLNSQELQAAIADAAKQKHDRRVRVSDN